MPTHPAARRARNLPFRRLFDLILGSAVFAFNVHRPGGNVDGIRTQFGPALIAGDLLEIDITGDVKFHFVDMRVLNGFAGEHDEESAGYEADKSDKQTRQRESAADRHEEEQPAQPQQYRQTICGTLHHYSVVRSQRPFTILRCPRALVTETEMERSFNFGLSDVRSVLTRLVRPIQFLAGISGPEQRSTEASSGGGESVPDMGKRKASSRGLLVAHRMYVFRLKVTIPPT